MPEVTIAFNFNLIEFAFSGCMALVLRMPAARRCHTVWHVNFTGRDH